MVFKEIGGGVLHVMGEAINILVLPFQGRDEEIEDAIIELCYDKYFRTTLADFYHSVCDAVEEINRKKGRTQFKIPSTTAIKRVYSKSGVKGKKMTKEKFGACLHELYRESGITGFGAIETLYYLFGVPASALFIKNIIKPQAISDNDFIPAVTSATVLMLSKFNKI